MTPSVRLFLILWLVAMAGVLSLLLVDIPTLIAAFPFPEGTPPPEPPPAALLKIAILIQPCVLAALAVMVGVWLAPRVGLHSPAAEAASQGSDVWPVLRPQLLPGAIGGLLAGTAVVLTWVIAKPFLPAIFITRAEGFNKFIPPPVRFLYGGLTEEILLRWGVMTLLVWLLWKILQRQGGTPQNVWFVSGIVGSAVLFGIGHLPVASALAGGLTAPVVAYVVTANSIFGIVAGFLYWRSGLEAAILAHVTAHIVLIAAIAMAL